MRIAALAFLAWSLCLPASAECMNRDGGDVNEALHNCTRAAPHCLRGIFHSAGTMALINGSPVARDSKFCFHKSSWQREPGSNSIPDPEGNALLWSGYDQVAGLSEALRRSHALDSEAGVCLTGAQLISMGIARECR